MNTASGSQSIWTSAEAAVATHGTASKEWNATGISIDTRTIKPGDLFIAIKGDTMDGHAFVADALAKGAAAAVVSRIPDGVRPDAPLLVVTDTMAALQDLGRTARFRTGARVIGITGSVGKTGTKEMLAAAFGALGQTHASRGSFNNHWGVPYTLAAMHPGCDYGIFEMGMNHANEITPLTKMVRPDIAIITTVAPVHIENFSSEKDIADAKAEIFNGMDHNGIAVLPHDNQWFSHLKAAAQTQGVQVLSFGEHADSDIRMVDCLEAANGSRIRADVMGEDVSFTLLIPGRHIAINALSVLGAVKASGGDIKKAVAALEKIEPIAGRGKRELLNIGEPDNPVTLIDESYNASPPAMRAAFKVLALVDPGRGGKRIAFLGDMLELGADGPRQHADLALPLQTAGVDLVYTCGTLMKNLYDALPANQRGAHKSDSKQLAEIVPDVLTPGDVVMVKGSHGSRMDIVVETLRALPGQRKNGIPANRKGIDHAL